MKYKTALILDSGDIYYGKSFAKTPPTVAQCDILLSHASDEEKALAWFAGELVFNTAMSGYVEVLSDPSFSGQLICMTYPHIGNYGVVSRWSESGRHTYTDDTHTVRASDVMAAGLIVKQVYEGPVPQDRMSLAAWLRQEQISGICGVDTRDLTLRIRDHGSQNAAIVSIRTDHEQEDIAKTRKLISHIPKMEGRNLVSQVVLQEAHTIDAHGEKGKYRVGVLDMGCKQNIIRLLQQRSCIVTLLPEGITKSHIIEADYDFVLLSNGPGDPSVLESQRTLIASLVGAVPLCGICLGTQLLALSIGADTYKLAFGHHGINHPVRDERNNKLYVTSQNHGFAVDEHTLPSGAIPWFRNTNDNTLEGFIYEEKNIYSVQFHPEAAPGPSDTLWIIDYFIERAIHARQGTP